jgi:hypothetical protein
MLRTFALGLVAVGLVACTGAEPVDTTADAGVQFQAPHAKHATALVFSCRKACWDDVPFNACKTQRNACFHDATDKAGKDHCREMSRTCRKIRRSCLEACNNTDQAAPESP